ncbi:MAG TPA: glycosyltransferase family 87 protein [Acidobacteriaceae bacterium]|nr:glycosyltransferase family 87 protein [Acidobacteriaceae bacterium]
MFFTQKRLKLYLGALLALQVCTLLTGIPIVARRYIDFRAFYTAGSMLRTGHAAQLYDYAAEQHFQSALVSPEPRALPFMPPPFTALPFAPLSLLSFWTAYFVFAAINCALLFAAYSLLRPFLTALSARWKPAPALLILSFLPAAIALLMGQLSILLLLLFCAAFVCLRRNHNLAAGLILSLALIKFQVALPVALLFLLWRQWRFIAGFLSGSALLTALSIYLIGPTAFVAYLHSLFSMTTSVTADRALQLHFAILPEQMPNLYGLLFTLTRAAAWPHILPHILILAASLALFVWTALQRPSLPLALCTAMLVSYHLFFYDLTLLLLPLPLLADHLLRNPTPNYRLLITQISLGALLVSPLLRFLIAGEATCWLALPIIGLTLASTWWPRLDGPPQPAPLAAPALHPALHLAPAT